MNEMYTHINIFKKNTWHPIYILDPTGAQKGDLGSAWRLPSGSDQDQADGWRTRGLWPITRGRSHGVI